MLIALDAVLFAARRQLQQLPFVAFSSNLQVSDTADSTRLIFICFKCAVLLVLICQSCLCLLCRCCCCLQIKIVMDFGREGAH
jgi:hypothetical protein